MLRQWLADDFLSGSRLCLCNCLAFLPYLLRPPVTEEAMELSSARIKQKKMRPEGAMLVFRDIPDLESYQNGLVEATNERLWRNRWLGGGGFACASMVEKREEFAPTTAQLLKHPLALAALVPRDASLFAAGAVAGAAAKTVTAPLDRIKLIMQTHGLRAAQGGAKKGIGFIEAFSLIGKQEGIKGYWKGNLPQKLFRGKDGELSVFGRLAAGACAGMTSTFVSIEKYTNVANGIARAQFSG
ncbi:hypothetical protein U1Q18_008548 [Sarracenia purpurea var. burkii]